jgi:hypothetical protein
MNKIKSEDIRTNEKSKKLILSVREVKHEKRDCQRIPLS